MIVIDAVANWFLQNGPGIVVGLALVMVFLVVVAKHVERENNRPGQ